jgi:malate dehydrogenase
LLSGVVQTDNADEAFDGVNYALLVGSRPRTAGMERADLLSANGAIFTVQGKALSDRAADDVRILVVGNPANTNCLIAQRNAPKIDPRRFTAMMRLDHNRAMAQVANKAGVPVTEVRRMTIWGNHSATQYPDLFHAQVSKKGAARLINDRGWMEKEFIPTVQQRGAAIIGARGSSSAASAANAAIDHVHDWALGTKRGDWVSMAVYSDGSYDVPEGLISSFPVTTKDGEWSIVPDLHIDKFSRGRIDTTVAELAEERDAVQSMGLLG